MPHDRFYINVALTPSSEIVLTDEEAHHLYVMRPQVDDVVELVNGKGELASARIKHLHKKEIQLSVQSCLHQDAPAFSFIIAQGIPRMARLETILEKGTELGMTELWLFPGDRSEKTIFNETQKERLKKILIASMKQCGTLFLPELKWLPPLSKWQPIDYPLFFGAFHENIPSFFTAWKQIAPQKGALFVVGPESGLTEKEEHALKTLRGKGVSLHANILRTDTAPLAALTLMSHFHQISQKGNEGIPLL